VQVYRGSDIGSAHCLLVTKMVIMAKWKKCTRKEKLNKEEIFKVHLLQEQSVRVLYQKRLEKYLLERSVVKEIEQEWKNIKMCIYKAAEESLGKKFKRKKPKRLRIWNEETETATREEKSPFNISTKKNS
jgi:hypothetical protein